MIEVKYRKTLYFEDNYSFAEYIEDVYTDIIDDDVDSDVAVLGHFNDIRIIASELCMYGYTLHSVSGLVDTEKDEFVLAIFIMRSGLNQRSFRINTSELRAILCMYFQIAILRY